MAQTIIQVDAFTDRPFGGNPAAVCVLDRERDEAWMQAVALEMNLSETAFPVRSGDDWQLRWFTPAVEVELCGHATLGTAHVLFSDGLAPAGSTITFHTKSGPLRARQDGEYIVLDFPALEVRPGEPVSGVIEALRVTPVGFNRTRSDYLVEVSTEQAVRQCDPDQALLKKAGVRGVIVTAGGSGDYDFVSRFFAPGAGIAEDPVTGSAHCALAPYWQKKLGKDTMLAYQASARGGEVRVTVRGDRVELAGKAVITLRGELLV